jgi:environmental stress-induced protein Ves
MPSLVHLTHRDYRRVPWRNGGGTTTELLAEPGPGGRFLWRLSIAEVASSGPFSDFSGYERHILLLSGNGVVLRFPEAPARRLDRRLEPFVFDGGWRAECELIDGPVRDLNLMVARGTAVGRLRVLRTPTGGRAEIPLEGTVLVHLLEGVLETGSIRLEPGDTLRADGRAGGRVVAAARGKSLAVVATISAPHP